MVKKIVLFVHSFLLCSCLIAQTTGTKKMGASAKFHSYNTAQVLNGSSGTALALTSVNGVQFNRFFMGAGVGYDYYFLRSVPLFAEARYKLSKQTKAIQLFADCGTNFSFDKKNGAGKNRPGIYWGGGFDYFIPAHDNAFTFGLGYSSKKVVQLFDNLIYNPVEGVVQNAAIQNEYLLSRVAIRFGWMF